MLFVLAISPVAIAALSILVFGQSALRAGAMGLVVTLLLASTVPQYLLEPAEVAFAVSDGLLTTLGVAYVLLGGVLLYEAMQGAGVLSALSREVVRAIPDPRHQLFALVFGVSVFFESATGFGVGIVVVVPLFLALGFDPVRAATLALMGQCAIPFGAMAVGTVLGSELSGISESTLGELSVLISLPYIVVSGAAAMFVAGLWRARAADLMWLVIYSMLLALALWLGSVSLGVELTGSFAGLLIVFVAWCVNRAPESLDPVSTEDGARDGIGGNRLAGNGPDDAGGRDLSFGLAVTPLVFLMVALMITRLFPPVRSIVEPLFAFELPLFNFSLSPIYHPGFWLVLAAGVTVVLLKVTATEARTMIKSGLMRWTMATLAVAGFIVFGKLMVLSGMTTQIATDLAALTGRAYSVAVPVIGGLGGFLTASNAASNALFMNLQLSAATHVGMPLDLAAASQNAAGSNTSLASPGRLVFASAMTDGAASEAVLLRRVLPLAIAGVVGAILMTLVLERIGY